MTDTELQQMQTNLNNTAQVICDAATKIAELLAGFYNDLHDNNFRLLQKLETHNVHPSAHNAKFAEIINQVSTIRNSLQAIKEHDDEQDVILGKVVLSDDIIVIKPDTNTLDAITIQK